MSIEQQKHGKTAKRYIIFSIEAPKTSASPILKDQTIFFANMNALVVKVKKKKHK